jgi:plasmid stability protein
MFADRERPNERKDGTTVATVQVKRIDENLYRALRVRAKRDNRSISRQVVKCIQDSLAGSSGSAEERGGC